MQPKSFRQVVSHKCYTTLQWWKMKGMSWVLDLFSFLVVRGGAVAVESSGMPTVPNNLRLQTLDRSSIPSDNRRVRVSNWYTQTQTHIQQHTEVGGGNFLLTYLVCVFVFFSPTERRASPVYTPATACLRKKLPAITGRIRTPQPFLCPGPQFHQVSPLQPRPLALLCNIFASRRSSMTPAVVSQLHSSHTNISIIRATVLRCVIGAAVSYQR